MQRRGEENEEEGYIPFLTPAQRRAQEKDRKSRSKPTSSAPSLPAPPPPAIAPTAPAPSAPAAPQESLFSIAKRMRQEEDIDPQAARLREEAEAEKRVLESALAAKTQSLLSAKELAMDAQVSSRPAVSRLWRPLKPRTTEDESQLRAEASKLIVVDGDDVPALQLTFEQMNLPRALLAWLRDAKLISRPSPIQQQGLPVCLSGRDMIGVASTGSGKTLCFAIPSVLISLEELNRYEGDSRLGPFVLVLGPSRELMRQTFQIIEEACQACAPGLLRATLAIGGEDKSAQLHVHRTQGSQICVGTPGRVLDFLNSKPHQQQRGGGRGGGKSTSEVSLSHCTLLVLDEGDRMMDEGFDDVVKQIMGHFTPQRARQTLLFSATMPRRVIEFAQTALQRPVLVNVGRAGAASANITQHVEPMLRREDRFLLLLQALQRTEPPVLVFTSKNNDVDDVHLYLLLKGLRARGIHAKKSQQDRNQAVDDFKAGLADILVASDVGAKGLDFANIQHVINLDLPAEIENYVHRIGRTGRGGVRGEATSFVDLKSLNDQASLLADLAGILRDARQRVPKFLVGGNVGEFEDPPVSASDSATAVDSTCTVCGGFGHRVLNCPKLSQLGKRNQARDIVTGGDY